MLDARGQLVDIKSKKIYETASRVGFLDPITKLPPRDERSISALLCIYHQQGKIDWAKVPLLDAKCQQIELTAEAVLGQPGILCSEYTLFWATKSECNAYGDMRPDFLYIASGDETAAIIENKLGAGDTHKRDHYGGQFGRYIQYLKQASAKNKYMILLTSKCYLPESVPGYASQLQLAEKLQRSAASIRSVIICWEDVLGAFAK